MNAYTRQHLANFVLITLAVAVLILCAACAVVPRQVRPAKIPPAERAKIERALREMHDATRNVVFPPSKK